MSELFFGSVLVRNACVSKVPKNLIENTIDAATRTYQAKATTPTDTIRTSGLLLRKRKGIAIGSAYLLIATLF